MFVETKREGNIHIVVEGSWMHVQYIYNTQHDFVTKMAE